MDDQFYRKVRPRASILNRARKLGRNKIVLVTLFVVILVFSFVTFSNRGILKRVSLKGERSAMIEKIQRAQAEQVRLQNQLKALENDPKAIERVAREKYGMIREGETVYKVKKDK